MRALIQRVSEASVSIDGQIKDSIDRGLLVFLGIETEDNEEDIEWLATKICNLRIFSDDQGLMNKEVGAVNGEILLISQFTLHAKTKKGNRPSYIRAAGPEYAIPLYEKMLERLEQISGKPIACGTFGADMKVALVNDGPVTIWIDSKNKE